MKIRVFLKSDGSLIVSRPSEKYQSIPNFEGCRFPEATQGLSYVDLEDDGSLDSSSKNGVYHEMFFFDGSPSKQNLKRDDGWVVQLMPPCLIHEKHLAKLNQKLDAELERQNPDLPKVLKWQRQKEICRTWDKQQWYQQALANLDERVAGGEPDKPVIRQKLQAKINENL